MQVITDQAILQRAKEFCSQNGTHWENLTDYNRKRYLTRAREQLLDEEADALVSRGLFRDPHSGNLAPISLVLRGQCCASGETRSRNPLGREQFTPRLVEFSSAA